MLSHLEEKLIIIVQTEKENRKKMSHFKKNKKSHWLQNH